MASKSKLYLLRGDVSAALSTGRPQLLVGLKQRLANGTDSLTREEQVSLLELVADCIEQREKEADARHETIEQIQEQVSSKIYEMGQRLAAFSGDIDAVFERMLKKNVASVEED